MCEAAPGAGGEEAVKLSSLIAPPFYALHRDIRRGLHTHYWLAGGRGSGKSTFVSVEIVLGLMRHPGVHAICLRKVKDTLKDSVFAQLQWAIERLGVGDKWKEALSPLRLTYLPTGQQIFFRGLDRASKTKSLRPKFGYFGYIWLEELDEFAGAGEVRMAIQSLLRGGERFFCFYTYNPPRGRRSWVNAAAAEGEAQARDGAAQERGAPAPHPGEAAQGAGAAASPARGGLLVHHSDYRGMPREWLGEPFIAQAEHLRGVNPALYAHEYLGEVAKTGAEVFANLRLRPIPDGQIAQFERLNRGLDFGYASDPLHYTVNCYDSARRRLYIFYELHLLRTPNSVLAQKILQEMRLHGRGYVCCDSAEPKSIDDLHLLGVPVYGARKGQGSLGWGMRFLSEEVEEIVIDPARCPNAAREFYGYELERDKDQNLIPSYPDRDNHAIDATRYALERRIRARYAGQRDAGR